jgi:hypothetical protein
MMNNWAAAPTRKDLVPDFLEEARDRANELLRGPRLWWETREESRRYRASSDPAREYADELEWLVANAYEREHGFYAYTRDTGRYAVYKPATNWWQRWRQRSVWYHPKPRYVAVGQAHPQAG